jgi:hypothetical protein
MMSAHELRCSTKIVKAESFVEVGYILLDGPGPQVFGEFEHEFIVISEAEYFGFGKEKLQVYDDADAGFLLYNVMLVAYDEERRIANRLGCGRIYKKSWKEARPRSKVIILS